MSFEMIDFHTHPFIQEKNNICRYQDVCDMSPEKSREEFLNLGVSKICGSVISTIKPENGDRWAKVKEHNDQALALKELYGDFYVPGFHVHPDFLEQSLEEMYRMQNAGVHLIGELVPYIDDWSVNYASDAFSVLLEEAAKLDMVVSIHTQDLDAMDEMVKNHPDTVIVAAHPGEQESLLRHLERMKMSENYYLDLSGTGLFRYGSLRKIIDTVGADRVLFGSDFPICNTAMFLGGVLLDPRISEGEKKLIFADNAKRLLQL